MKTKLTLFIAVMLLLLPIFGVPLSHAEKPVTPYGDYCDRCGHYGSCRSLMSNEESEKAMEEYYQKKGLRVDIEKARGRFIKARIKENGTVVDVIIFDRRTGRVRSVY